MTDRVLDGVTSDPVAMGWMQGMPPPLERRIVAAHADHMRFPTNRYAYSNMREFLPTLNVARGQGAARALPVALRDDIDAIVFTPLGDGAPVRWDDGLIGNYTDGIVVLHRGAVVYDRWFGVTGPQSRHIVFSVTKSFVGTVAEMLIEQGLLDPSAPVVDFVPELARSGFGDATVRQVMDMTTALDFSEDYTDPTSGIGAFSAALGLTPRPPGYAGPQDLYAYLPTVAKAGTHGERFTYRTCNTEVLGWIVARIEGQRLHRVLSDRLWGPLGLADDADMLVDSAGTPFAGGGLNPTLHDLARFGEALRLDGAGVIPPAAVARIRAGGDRAHFAQADYPQLPGWSYRSQWWISHDAHETFSARGIHGQTLHVDPAAEMVVARFASHPIAANGANDVLSLPAWAALAEHLQRG
ncbi:serine hydrolase domain-containing protein [Novosphingobium lentum]|uniref:serine hydrolase domain-containing protein n=1 Tax=Novosphingobium lentum TaxID=145287 RepID=UPI00082E42C6|nr:serine hydrolase domain-containing protein [Novosphingobium lentum]